MNFYNRVVTWVHSILERISSPVSYSTSGGLILFGYTLGDIALLVGILTGVLTCAVNWYYKMKEREDRLNGKTKTRRSDLGDSSSA